MTKKCLCVYLFWTMCHEQQTNSTFMCLCLYLHDRAWYVCVCMNRNLLPWKSWLKLECKNEIAAMKSVCFRHMPTQNRQCLTQFFFFFDYGIRVVTTDIYETSSEKKQNFVPYCESLPHFLFLSSIHSFSLPFDLWVFFSKPTASTPSFQHL